jgi:pilus assembly protein Flp/PilA
MRRLCARYLADERGATAIEYGLIASLIAVTIIAVLLSIGVNLRDRAQEIADAIAEAGTSALR